MAARSLSSVLRRYSVQTAPRLAATFRALQEPFDHRTGSVPLTVGDPVDALRAVLKSSASVFVHSAAATPTPLLHAMVAAAKASDLSEIGRAHV